MPRLKVFFPLLAALVAFSLLYQNAYAVSGQIGGISSVQCIITNTALPVGDCLASAFPLALLGIALSILISAIAYMASEVFNYEPLKGFYKRELWETAKSVLILGLVFAGLILASAVAVSLAGSAPSSAIQYSTTALTNNLAALYTTTNSAYLAPQLSTSYSAFGAITALSVGYNLANSTSLSTWIPIPLKIVTVRFGSDAPLLQDNVIGQLIGFASDLVIAMVLAFQIQSDMIYVIAAVGLGILIPIGIVMRAIPFLRGIGGTMIAIGIGLSIVYPALLVGFNLPITNYISATVGAGATNFPQNPGLCPTSSTLLCYVWNGLTSLVNNIVGYVGGGIPLRLAFGPSTTFPSTTISNAAMGFWIGALGPFGIAGDGVGIFPIYNFILANVTDLILQSMLFVLDIIIGVAIVSNLATVLGGRLSPTLGVGKFKLA